MFLIETFELNTSSEPFSNFNTLLETLQWATVVNIISNIPINHSVPIFSFGYLLETRLVSSLLCLYQPKNKCIHNFLFEILKKCSVFGTIKWSKNMIYLATSNVGYWFWIISNIVFE